MGCHVCLQNFSRKIQVSGAVPFYTVCSLSGYCDWDPLRCEHCPPKLRWWRMNGELHKPLPWIIRRGRTEYDPLIFRFGNASSPTSTKAACNEKRKGQVLTSPRSLITAPPGCGCVARAPSQNRRKHVLRLL